MSRARKTKKKACPEPRRRVFVGMPSTLRSGRSGDCRKKVFIGLSGGVDSSVAAALFKEATPNNFQKLFGRPTPKGFRGYDVVGVHIKCWSPTGDCGVADAEDARRVAEKLNIPFYVWNFEKEYKAKVVDYMIEGYRKGLTPNPDIMCNREIKFGIFLKKALRLGADYVATGHYVRLRRKQLTIDKKICGSKVKSQKSISLYTARDKNKDQSYFLWTLTQWQLAHCLFPIGEYEKKEVRAMAKKFGLPTAEKKDSQGICFMGRVTIGDFLNDYISQKSGNIVTTDGQVIGQHQGVYPYTVGQRYGLRLGAKNQELGIRGRHKTPAHYVAEKNVVTNTVVVAEGDSHPALYRKEVELSDVNFISPIIHNSRFMIQVLVRIRYRQPLQKACLLFAYSPFGHTQDLRRELENSTAHAKLVFDEPIKFVAEGQSAVFYASDGDSSTSSGYEMIGGGIIQG